MFNIGLFENTYSNAKWPKTTAGNQPLSQVVALCLFGINYGTIMLQTSCKNWMKL